eukprot:586155-Rhodomonas_salina.1
MCGRRRPDGTVPEQPDSEGGTRVARERELQGLWEMMLRVGGAGGRRSKAQWRRPGRGLGG